MKGMILARAKIDAGVRVGGRPVIPRDAGGKPVGPTLIEKGKLYWIYGDYDFGHRTKDASGKTIDPTIFEKMEKAKGK